MDKLSQLRLMTTVVADTGDIAAIKAVKPIDATTNPSLILKASHDPLYQGLIDDALIFAKTKSNLLDEQAGWAARKVAVNFGVEILKHVPGRVSTEVDAHLSFDTAATLREADILMDLYAAAGIGPERILIKIASTWEGIAAAENLEKKGIQCNLTLLFHMSQAMRCADAGVTLISPFVGRIYDWYKLKEQKEFLPSEDPGVHSVKAIYDYYKTYHYPTIIMGASFRTTGQLEALAGCDYLTVSPNLLEALAQDQGELKRALDPHHLGAVSAQHILTESEFRIALNEDAMSTEKLAEGIRLFCRDLKALKGLLTQKLQGNLV
ncbi:MAG: transaldolase [Gammaproteobacteria bacterium]|nr:transaldolase [Gammaproteobacteria bacterium]